MKTSPLSKYGTHFGLIRPGGYVVIPHCASNLHPPFAGDVEHLFTRLLVICEIANPVPIFFNGLSLF